MLHFRKYLQRLHRLLYLRNANNLVVEPHLKWEFSFSQQSLPLGLFNSQKSHQHPPCNDRFLNKNRFTLPLFAFGLVIAGCAKKDNEDPTNVFFGKGKRFYHTF